MANANKPFGLRPVGTLNGAPWSNAVRKFHVPATDSSAIFVGDTVKLAGTEAVFQGELPIPTATIAASGDVVLGVMVGVEPLPGNLDYNYRVADVAMNILVCCDPQAIYMIQGDVDTYDAADVGLNMDYTVVAGSTVTGVSKTVADQSSAASTNTLDLQILGTVRIPDNDLTGGYPLLLAKLNLCQYSNGATGI